MPSIVLTFEHCASRLLFHRDQIVTAELFMSVAMIEFPVVAGIEVPQTSNHSHDSPNPTAPSEKQQATARFNSAQKLFQRQSSVCEQTVSQMSRIELSRSRTSTISSISTGSERSYHSISTGGYRSRTSSDAPSSIEDTSSIMGPSVVQFPSSGHQLVHSSDPLAPVDEGCILLGPRRSLVPLDVTQQIQASTTNGSPVWYCRRDKLVVFEGVRVDSGLGVKRLITRSSRGLAFSRRNCEKLSIRVEIPCHHCQAVLKRSSWVFHEQVLETRVCRACQDRCWAEWERQKVQQLEDARSWAPDLCDTASHSLLERSGIVIVEADRPNETFVEKCPSLERVE